MMPEEQRGTRASCPQPPAALPSSFAVGTLTPGSSSKLLPFYVEKAVVRFCFLLFV